MRAMANLVLVVFAMIAVFIILIPALRIVFFGSASYVNEVVQQKGIYVGEEALRAAKYYYLPAALRFSAYQSCFDTFRA
ncbi:MAG: hypothetical protein HY519_03275, partial [Candidatus Aenigmarchaeota archaeon]|nr:hypothetical protein [Candidatus Aenigmarchaeota archaeon]